MPVLAFREASIQPSMILSILETIGDQDLVAVTLRQALEPAEGWDAPVQPPTYPPPPGEEGRGQAAASYRRTASAKFAPGASRRHRDSWPARWRKASSRSPGAELRPSRRRARARRVGRSWSMPPGPSAPAATRESPDSQCARGGERDRERRWTMPCAETVQARARPRGECAADDGGAHRRLRGRRTPRWVVTALRRNVFPRSRAPLRHLSEHHGNRARDCDCRIGPGRRLPRRGMCSGNSLGRSAEFA